MWQIFLAIADWILASLTLYVLIPSGEIQYFVLLKVFLVAQFLAIISQVPGGMGVFETTIALLIPSTASNPAVIAGLLVYRAVFYFFPLFTALILLGIFEIVRFVKKAKSATKVFNQTFSSIVVQILALCAFFAGVFSTFSTAVPLESAELKFIVKLPIWIADWAHFLLSVSAITLLFISRGLQQRIKNAFTISCFLISFSIMLMLIVGGHFLLFTWFIFLFIVLLFSKNYFYRKISIFNASLNIWWISSICGVFFLSALIGFFINKQDIFYWLHIKTFFFNIFEYSNTARFLRTNFGVGIIIIIVCLEQVLKNFLRKPTCFRNEDIRSIVSSSNYAYSVKSFLDDKEFVISDKKDAFIMYSQSKNCWIALGDPIGEPKSKPELLWKFKELAEKKSAILAFIGIAHKYLDIYSDLGFNSFLIGKEAKINLKVFGEHVVPSLASLGKHIESKGFLFRQLSSSEFKKYEVIFDNIDTEWQKNLGYVPVNFIPSKYDKFYAKNFNFAVVEKDSAIIAFAILENTANKYEACSSIIRYVKCDYDIFSYLILKIILNAKESGFKFFDLGPAHFSIDNTEEDIMLKQFSKTFMFAEHLGYDSGRLRKFKEQFNPLWSNKYLAAPPGKYMLRFIKNFVSLIFEQKTVMRKHFFRNIFKRNLSEK
jgi:phosphatidylglycerol lysyltransferase